MSQKQSSDSALSKQVGGQAYSKTYPEWPIQPVEFIHKNGIDFIRGCVIKYVCRDRFKNGHEDLLKARHYIDLLLELDKNEEELEGTKAEPSGKSLGCSWHVTPEEVR